MEGLKNMYVLMFYIIQIHVKIPHLLVTTMLMTIQEHTGVVTATGPSLTAVHIIIDMTAFSRNVSGMPTVHSHALSEMMVS